MTFVQNNYTHVHTYANTQHEHLYLQKLQMRKTLDRLVVDYVCKIVKISLIGFDRFFESKRNQMKKNGNHM